MLYYKLFTYNTYVWHNNVRTYTPARDLSAVHVQTRVYPEVDRETNELFGAISREGSAKPEQDRPTLETSTRAGI